MLSVLNKKHFSIYLTVNKISYFQIHDPVTLVDIKRSFVLKEKTQIIKLIKMYHLLVFHTKK